jgi:hypothetical protein
VVKPQHLLAVLEAPAVPFDLEAHASQNLCMQRQHNDLDADYCCQH